MLKLFDDALQELIRRGVYSMYEVEISQYPDAAYLIITPEKNECCNRDSCREYLMIDVEGQYCGKVDSLDGIVLGKPYIEFNTGEIRNALIQIKNGG